LDALYLVGQAPIDRSLVGVHPPPLIPVVLEVSPILLETLHPSGQSPDRSDGPARPDPLGTPHVEGRQEEQKDARSEDVRANAVIVTQGVLHGRHGADCDQKTAHDPHEQTGAVPRGAFFGSTRRGLVLLGRCHDDTIVICDG
jgi:hypothetical protein